MHTDSLQEMLFGRTVTPAERLRQHQRSLAKAQRELDRERGKLEQQEKKLIMDIKKSAKAGQVVRVTGVMVYLYALNCTVWLECMQGHGKRPRPYTAICAEILSDAHAITSSQLANTNTAK